jgi:hypothetical protein
VYFNRANSPSPDKIKLFGERASEATREVTELMLIASEQSAIAVTRLS